jgi:IclR family acetate operon transcriptional repressor
MELAVRLSEGSVRSDDVVTVDVELALDPLGRQPSYTSTRRIFRIIDLVSRSGDQLTVKVLARDLGISVSTCYQLMAILIDEGYIERLSHRAGYRLGPTVTLLFERSRKSGRTVVVGPVLRDLAHRARRAAYFAILSEGDRVLVTHVCSPLNCPPVGVPEGFSGPAHALALGKVLIAAGGSAAINRYVERHELWAFTNRTITDPALLEVHLKDVKARGYATEFEEFARGLCSVAAPVGDERHTRSGAIGLTTIARSPDDEVKRMIVLAQRAANVLSTALLA